VGSRSFGISVYTYNFKFHTVILHLLSVSHSSEPVILSLTLPFWGRLSPAVCSSHFCSLASAPWIITLLRTSKGLSTKVAFVFFQEQWKHSCLTLQSHSLFCFFPKSRSNYLSLLNSVKTKPKVNPISTNVFTAVSHRCYTCFC